VRDIGDDVRIGVIGDPPAPYQQISHRWQPPSGLDLPRAPPGWGARR
jgi:hypothetical protein